LKYKATRSLRINKGAFPALFGATPLILFLLLLLLICGCELKFDGKWGKKGDKPTPAPPVLTEEVQLGAISTYFRFNAPIQPEREVHIFAQASGIVKSRQVEEGDYIAESGLLITLENDEQKLALDRARSNYNHQKLESDRGEELYRQGMLPDDNILKLRLALKETEFSLEQARIAFERTEVRAPFQGVITKRNIDVGDRVDPARPLFTLVDRNHLLIDGWVSEAEASKLSLGQTARVMASDSVTTTEARLLRIGTVVDPTYGKIKITFILQDSERSFRPGQYVEVRLTLEVHNNIIVSPKRAVLYEAGSPVVFVVVDSIAFRRPIVTGAAEGNLIEVLKGLEIGERLVIEGQTTLKDSSKVRPLPVAIPNS